MVNIFFCETSIFLIALVFIEKPVAATFCIFTSRPLCLQITVLMLIQTERAYRKIFILKDSPISWSIECNETLIEIETSCDACVWNWFHLKWSINQLVHDRFTVLKYVSQNFPIYTFGKNNKKFQDYRANGRFITGEYHEKPTRVTNFKLPSIDKKAIICFFHKWQDIISEWVAIFQISRRRNLKSNDFSFN